MEDATSPEKSKTAVIRAEFDKILMHHVSSLIDTREDIAALPFNLATITCLLLVAERENEIKAFPESPPKRYNRETFFADIEEIGIDLDEDAMAAFQNLERYGFVIVNAHSQYIARESASLLITVLDSIFPQMPGMNLVAYVSQAIEEVLTGRKGQDHALQQFDQTLQKQGVRLSALPEDRLASSAARRILTHEAPDTEVLEERRAAHLQKLKALRAKSLSSESAPSVVTGGGAQLKHVKIKELFPRKGAEPEGEPDETPPADTGSGIPSDISDDMPSQAALPDETIPDSVSPETAVVDADAEIVTDLPGSPPGIMEEPQAETVPEPPVMEAQELQTDAGSIEDSLLIEPETAAADAPEAYDVVEAPPSKEALIDQQIRQFEEELAMPCPICGTGKVLSDTTEKGKTYYHCSNEDCRLISWGKPYHMACPVCKNPFLVEVPEPDGQIGLKCPRATCSYRKKSLPDTLSDEKSAPGKRKVAVVKKKRKKGVRRVVRRKS